MKKSLFAFLLSWMAVFCYAQHSGSIKGRVIATDADLPGYSVILLSPVDSALVRGDYFSSETFSIPSEEFPVLLNVSSLGFRDTTLIVHSASDSIKIVLTVQPLEMGNVMVTARRPVFTATAERYSMHIAGSAASQSGSAADLLRKIARVKVGEHNEVSVLGRGEAVVLVDGRQLPGNRSLSSITSSEIERIAVIVNPSSKYDAGGKAVVEIITRRAQDKPWGAEITARLGKGDFWLGYAGAEATGRIGHFSLYGFYAYAPSKTLKTENMLRDYTATEFPQHIRNTMETTDRTKDHNFRFSADYRLSPRQNVGMQVSGQYSNIERNIADRNQLQTPVGSLPEDISSLQEGPLRRGFTSGTFYHSYRSDNDRFSITSLGDYSLYDINSSLHIHETGGQGSSYKENDETNGIDIFSLKSDLNFILPSKFTLETGLKLTLSRHNSTSRFLTGAEERLSDYHYREGIGAAYAILAKQYPRLRIEAGLRAEFSDRYARADAVIKDDRAANLFPSASLRYDIDDKWAVVSTYAAKITRPTFEDLNPAMIYLDSLSYSVGNPSLRPELHHTAELKLTYMGFASLGVSYTRAKDAFGWYLQQDAGNPSVTHATQKNIDRSDSWTVDLMLPYRNDHMTVYLATGVIFTRTDDRETNVVGLRQPMWYCYSGLDLDLPWKLKWNTNIGYYTKGVANIFIAEPMFRLDVGLQRRFYGDRINVSLLWNDIFRSAEIKSYATMNNRYLHYGFYDDQSFVQLSVSYRFRGQKNEYQSHSASERDIERIKGLNR